MLRAYRVPECRERYDARDAILYALGTGAGLSDTVDELHFVFERRLQALPTLALVLGTPGFWPMDPASGLDWRRVVLAELSLRLSRPMETEGELVGTARIGDITGPEAGHGTFHVHRTLTTLSGMPVADIEELWGVRDGGVHTEAQEFSASSWPVPEAAPDAVIDLPTSRQQAMLYRTSGDRNPIHIDPETASGSGYMRPPLHAASVLGLVARGLIHLCSGGDPGRLTAISARFSGPVFPGETIRTEMWQQNQNILFRASCPERGAVVIDGGQAAIADTREAKGKIE